MGVIDAQGRVTDAVIAVTTRAVYVLPLTSPPPSPSLPYSQRLLLSNIQRVSVGPLAFDSGISASKSGGEEDAPWGVVIASTRSPKLEAALAKTKPPKKVVAAEGGPPIAWERNLGLTGLWAYNLSVLDSLVTDLAYSHTASTLLVPSSTLPRVTVFGLMKLIVATVSPSARASALARHGSCSATSAIPADGVFSDWDTLLAKLYDLDRIVYVSLDVLPATTLLPTLQTLLDGLSALPGLDAHMGIPQRPSLSGVLGSFVDAIELAIVDHFGTCSTARDHDKEVAFARSMAPSFSLLSSTPGGGEAEFEGPSISVPRVDDVISVTDAFSAISAALALAGVRDPVLDRLLRSAASAVAGVPVIGEAPVSFPPFAPTCILDVLYGCLLVLSSNSDLDIPYVHPYHPPSAVTKKQQSALAALTDHLASSSSSIELALHPPLSSCPERDTEVLAREIGLVVSACLQSTHTATVHIPPPRVLDAIHITSSSKGRSFNSKGKGVFTGVHQ